MMLQNPRTAAVIAELDSQAARFQLLALAVEVEEQNPQFVFAHDDDRLGKLQGLVALGGTAIGFIGLTQATGRKRKRRSRVAVWPLEEFADEEWVQDHLHELAGALTRTLEQLGVGRIIKGTN